MNRIAAALFAVLVASPVMGQGEQPYVESIEVRVVNVEVVVTDSANRHVRRLTRDDFELYENGKLQPITNFYEERDDIQPAVAPAAPAAGAPAAATPKSEKPRYIIFFLDDYSTHPTKRKPLFDALERFAETAMRPGDEAMVVSWNRTLKIVQPFTPDREAVSASIRSALGNASGAYFNDRRVVEMRVRGYLSEAIMGLNDPKALMSFPQAYDLSKTAVYQSSEEQNKRLKNLIADLRDTLRTLSGIEGRKALVFAGQQLPTQVNREIYAAVDEMFMPYSIHMRGIPLGRLVQEAGKFSQVSYHDELAREANTQGVALYMIHPTGAEGIDSAEQQQTTSEMVRFEEFANTAMAFNELSKKTGGLALAAGRNYDLVFDAVAADLGSFYSLGYRPEGKDENRDVEVRLKHPGMKVRFRRNVAVRPMNEEVADALVANAFVTPSRNELTVSLHAGEGKNKVMRRRSVPVEVRIAADQLALLPEGDSWVGGITVLFSTAEPKGRFSDVDQRQQAIRMNEKPKPGEYVSYNVDMVIRSNDQILSVAVIDNVSKLVGYARESIGKMR